MDSQYYLSNVQSSRRRTTTSNKIKKQSYAPRQKVQQSDEDESSGANDAQEDNVTQHDQSADIQDDDVPQKILVSPRQRKITQIIVSNQPSQQLSGSQSPRKPFASNNSDNNRKQTLVKYDPRVSKLKSPSEKALQGHPKQRLTSSTTNADGQPGKLFSGKGLASTAGTSGSQWSTNANATKGKQLLNHGNYPHSLKQPDTPKRAHNNTILNQKKLNTIDTATTATILKTYHTASAEQQYPALGRLNHRHQSEILQTVSDLPKISPAQQTSNALQTIPQQRQHPKQPARFAAAPRERSVPSQQPSSAVTARGVYYTRHQEDAEPDPSTFPASGAIGPGQNAWDPKTLKGPGKQIQQSERVSPHSSSKVFQVGQHQLKKRHGIENTWALQRPGDPKHRPATRHRMSQNEVKQQVCAEGDNEFAESIAENSVVKESAHASKDSKIGPAARPKQRTRHLNRPAAETPASPTSSNNNSLPNRSPSDNHSKMTPKQVPNIELRDHRKGGAELRRSRQGHEFRGNDDALPEAPASRDENEEGSIELQKKYDLESEEDRFDEYHQMSNAKNKKPEGDSQASIYFLKEDSPHTDVYYKQSRASNQHVNASVQRLSNISIQTPKPQPKPFNPPRASFTHFKRQGGRNLDQVNAIQHPGQKMNQVRGHSISYGAQKFDNHKNEMLGGDSEYSDIDVNSGEERDESNDNLIERSYSAGSRDFNDSNLSQSKADDDSRYYGKKIGKKSDRRDFSSRNHQAIKGNYPGSDHRLVRGNSKREHRLAASKQRTSSEKKSTLQSGVNRHSRMPSSSLRSQKSYFEDQYKSGEHPQNERSRGISKKQKDEYSIKSDSEGDDLREGSAFIVQDSNGPGSRCRKGSLNMRNKLNNKAAKNKPLKTYHLQLYNKHNFRHHDNIEVSSDGSQVDGAMSKAINRQILKKSMKLKVYTSSRDKGNEAAATAGPSIRKEQSLVNFNANTDEACQKNQVAGYQPFSRGSMRQSYGVRAQGTDRQQQPHAELVRVRDDELNQTRQNFSDEESCDVEPLDADSSTRSLNRQQSVSINRNIFELSLKLNELQEVPISKLRSNQQLKILDLSRNKIQTLPQDMFFFLPNLKKLVLDYNLLVVLPNFDEKASPDQQAALARSTTQRDAEMLSKLNHFSATNNKLIEFPLSVFLQCCPNKQGHYDEATRKCWIQRQTNIQYIALNDNSIQQIPSLISEIKGLRTLMLHSNPLSMLPLALHEIWLQMDVFSIDWFSYLQPLVGKILRIDNSSSFREDTSQAGGGCTIDEQETYAIELALDNVREKSRLNKKRDSNQSASKLKQNVVQKKNQSLIPALQNKPGVGSNGPARLAQRERSQRIHDKFYRMLLQTRQENEKSQNSIDFVTFSQFLFFFMNKGHEGCQPGNFHAGQLRKDTLASLKYGPKERSILHQLVEDNKIVLFRDLINLNSQYKDKDNKPVLDINELNHDQATPLIMALKNKHNEIAKYLLKFHSDQINIQLKSKKHGNAINLAIKGQNPEIIDLVLNHKQVKSTDTFVLAYIIPNFEKDPKENAKYMVKLIMDKGMNPNLLRERFLKKELVSQKKQKDENLPEKILDVSPIALACMKYQNNAINFIVKYNSTIREILILNRKIKKKIAQGSPNPSWMAATNPTSNQSQQYWALINSLDQHKADRVRKFFTYIEDISKNKGISLEKVIERNLKLFDFNQLSGPHLMHPLHFAVQANNLKAIEKFKKHMHSENINFFARDGENYQLPQEFASPCHPIYKVVLRIQKNLNAKKLIQLKVERAGGASKSRIAQQQQDRQDQNLHKDFQSIWESKIELNRARTDHFMPMQHRALNLRHSTYQRPKIVRQEDIINFSNAINNQSTQLQPSMQTKASMTLSKYNNLKSSQMNEPQAKTLGSQAAVSGQALNYNSLIHNNVLRNIDNKNQMKNQRLAGKQTQKQKLKAAFHQGSVDGQQNQTARESQISTGTLPYNVSQYQPRDSNKTNQTNATQKYYTQGAGPADQGGRGGANRGTHSSHVFAPENEFNQNNLEVLSNNSSTKRTARGSEKFGLARHYYSNQEKPGPRHAPKIQVGLQASRQNNKESHDRSKPKSTRDSLDRLQKIRSLKNFQQSIDNVNSVPSPNSEHKGPEVKQSKLGGGFKDNIEQSSLKSLDMELELNQKNEITPQHGQSIGRDWSSNSRSNYTIKAYNQGVINPQIKYLKQPSSKDFRASLPSSNKSAGQKPKPAAHVKSDHPK